MAKKWRACPYLGIRFWSFLGQLALHLLWKLKRALSIDWEKNLSYDDYFSVLKFWPIFGEKMGVATTRAPYGLWPPNPTTGWTFWANHYLELIMFSKFSGVNPNRNRLTVAG